MLRAGAVQGKPHIPEYSADSCIDGQSSSKSSLRRTAQSGQTKSSGNDAHEVPGG
jgi:hypothetical protein